MAHDNKIIELRDIDSTAIQALYQQIKAIYCQEDGEKSQLTRIQKTVSIYGYLPIPFSIAAEELAPAELFAALEAIFEAEGVMREGRFCANCQTNPILRRQYDNPLWLNQEQLKIESLSLSGLGNEVDGQLQGCFYNWLVKIATTARVPGKMPGTVFYLLPPYRRDPYFASAYCPISREIEPTLADSEITKKTGLAGEQQLQLFLLLAHLAGHPTMLDLLPQVGRFSKTVFALPHGFRWLNLPWLVTNLVATIDSLLQQNSSPGFRFVGQVLKEDVLGYLDAPDASGHDQERNLKIALRKLCHQLTEQVFRENKFQPGGENGIALDALFQIVAEKATQQNFSQICQQFCISPQISASEFLHLLGEFLQLQMQFESSRIRLTNAVLSADRQRELIENIHQQVCSLAQLDKLPAESDIDDALHAELISNFKKHGLWPVAGGCWNSAGHPIFRRMNPALSWEDDNSFPICDHYNHKRNLVNAFAGDMDIVAPWYYCFLDEPPTNRWNEPVITQYIEYCQEIYEKFRPCGFRIDHIDHSADYPTSLDDEGQPISYRVPLQVFHRLGESIRKEDPTFVLFAEYMGWGDETAPHLYHKYSENGIYTAISTDVVGEFRNNARVMLTEGNHVLTEHIRRTSLPFATTRIHDNHDRSHPDIRHHLSEFTADRALLKWVKCLFLPGGKDASRPILYIDGNQTHTDNSAFVDTFLAYKSLSRKNNFAFFTAFDSLLRYSLYSGVLKNGTSRLLSSDTHNNNEICCWIVDPANSSAPLLVIAHEWIDDNTTALSSVESFLLTLPPALRLDKELLVPNDIPENLGEWLESPRQLREIPAAANERLCISWDEQNNCQKIEFSLARNEFRIYILAAERDEANPRLRST